MLLCYVLGNALEKIKLVSNRPMLSFNEVFEEYDYKVEDLFHEALLGNLTIYVQTPPNLKVTGVCSMPKIIFNILARGVGGSCTKEEEEYFLEMIPELKEVLDSGEILHEEKRAERIGTVALAIAQWAEKITAMFKIPPQEDSQGVSSVGGMFSSYPDKGLYKTFYLPQLLTPSPISPFSIYLYQQGVDEGIALKPTNNIGSLLNSNEEFFIIPDSVVKLGESLEANKLFVMKSELQKLLPKDPRRLSELIPQGSGENKKFNSSRQHLSLIEAIGEYGCKLDDLFHEAARGKLTIYFQTPINWKVDNLCSIKSVVLLYSLGTVDKISKEEYISIFPELKNIKNADELFDFMESTLDNFKRGGSSFNHSEFKDQEILHNGPLTYYHNKGKYRAIYVSPIKNPCPISPVTFLAYFQGWGTVIVTKLNDRLVITDNQDEEFFIVPETEITLEEALKADKLFVMKNELQKFLPQDTQDQVEVNPIIKPEEEGSAIASPYANIPQILSNQTAEPTEAKTGLNPSQIASAFADIMWNYDTWKRMLADPPAWLLGEGNNVRLQKGKRGKSSPSIWNPYEIAMLLIEKQDSYWRPLDKAFSLNQFLAPWSEEWTEFMKSRSEWNDLSR